MTFVASCRLRSHFEHAIASRPHWAGGAPGRNFWQKKARASPIYQTVLGKRMRKSNPRLETSAAVSMSENYYLRCMATDNDLCLPVISKEQIDEIFWSTATMVFQLFPAKGPMPQVALDLEHLQVVDYGAFHNVTDSQRAYIKQLHSHAPILPEEMVYLALRSMFGFTWQMPESEDEIRRAATHEGALNRVLTRTALDLGNKIGSSLKGVGKSEFGGGSAIAEGGSRLV
jgi:hypothetical protein